LKSREQPGSTVIGVDLGATKIALGLVDGQDRIVATRRVPTYPEQGPRAVVERIAQSVAELEEEVPGTRAAALGICSPGPVDHLSGTLIDPPNLQGLHGAPLRQMLAERLEVPVCLEHDAKAAALGDFHYGAGRGERSMVYVVVGTGVGAAIILDGRLYRGACNSAGEVGHITLDREGELCSCGSRGCVETYVAGPWLARRYRWAQERAGGEEGAALDGADVARLAAAGDPLAAEVMRGAGEALGVAVASMAMILDVELYVIGGSVVKAGDLLLDPARRTVPTCSFRSVGCRVRIVPTALGDDGPILGCAWLARRVLRGEMGQG
jgi:glucokinase